MVAYGYITKIRLNSTESAGINGFRNEVLYVNESLKFIMDNVHNGFIMFHGSFDKNNMHAEPVLLNVNNIAYADKILKNGVEFPDDTQGMSNAELKKHDIYEYSYEDIMDACEEQAIMPEKDRKPINVYYREVLNDGTLIVKRLTESPFALSEVIGNPFDMFDEADCQEWADSNRA